MPPHLRAPGAVPGEAGLAASSACSRFAVMQQRGLKGCCQCGRQRHPGRHGRRGRQRGPERQRGLECQHGTGAAQRSAPSMVTSSAPAPSSAIWRRMPASLSATLCPAHSRGCTRSGACSRGRGAGARHRTLGLLGWITGCRCCRAVAWLGSPARPPLSQSCSCMHGRRPAQPPSPPAAACPRSRWVRRAARPPTQCPLGCLPPAQPAPCRSPAAARRAGAGAA